MMMMMLFSLLDEIEIDLSFVKIRIFFTFGEKIFAKIEWKDTSKKSWVGLGTSAVPYRTGRETRYLPVSTE
jgi:hypothetical protein